jgi:Flp pilus assembly pilin Flp
MKQFFTNLLKREEGQDIIEYGVLAFFISIVALTIIKLFAAPLQAMYQAVLDKLT